MVVGESVEGYKVKVQYHALKEKGKEARCDAIVQVILRSLRCQNENK